MPLIEQNGTVSVSDGAVTLDIPPELHDSVARHQQNLSRLIVSLRSAGVDEAMIESSVHVLVATYEAELLGAVKELMRGRSGG